MSVFTTSQQIMFDPNPFASHVDRIQQCSIKNFHGDLSFLDHVEPITSTEFIQRRDNLAKALYLERVDAFVLEPGYTFQYYGNISQTDWEPWEPEERPMLMIVEPIIKPTTGEVEAKTSFLSPHFEEGRVRMLGIPSKNDLDIVIWEEHWNPYLTLRDQMFGGKEGIKLMIDEELRDFIVRGLTDAGFQTVGLQGEVEAVKQTKTKAEIDILRAVNNGTVKAIRAMRPCLTPGLTENQVMDILDNTLRSIGFQPFFDIVLIEENAALPHGGFVTGDNKITEHSMILIDVGAHYLGYSSDVCRSFFVDSSKNGIWERILSAFYGILTQSMPTMQSKSSNDDLLATKLAVWSLVLEAQAAARAQFLPNATAASVDMAARNVISSAGYGPQFTHRVGHGIGIKAHESPYLNKGNHGTKLKAGMVFTDEPGVYILGKFGVRHEDVYLVKEKGEAENLSGGEAKGPWDP
jgi:Xaa-Pro aminopeptidase